MLKGSCLAAVITMMFAGCGSSSTSTDGNRAAQTSILQHTSPAKPTKAEYIARADAICKQGNVALKSAAERFYRTRDAATSLAAYPRVADALVRVVDVAESFGSKVQALPLPVEKRGAVAYVHAMQEQAAVERLLADALRDEDAARISEIGQQLQDVSDRRHAVAVGYGFRECGRAGTVR